MSNVNLNLADNIKFSVASDIDIIEITADYQIEGIYFFTRVYFEEVIKLFCGIAEIELLTLKPLRKSIGRELAGQHDFLKLNAEEVLINYLGSSNYDTLSEILNSIDFDDGNVCFVKRDSYPMKTRIGDVYQWIKDEADPSRAPITHSFCYPQQD